MTKASKLLYISFTRQNMLAFSGNRLWRRFVVSTGKNGIGERQGSEKTPRGWHRVHTIIGQTFPENTVWVARQPTGEIYTKALAKAYPERDWILTRIIQIEGLEQGRNLGGDVDTLKRFIYIHGTPDTTPLGMPGSHGCIRMANADVMALTEWVDERTLVYLEEINFVVHPV